MITKKEEYLIVGKRYWLDGIKDVSGVYAGKDGGYCFNQIEGEIGLYQQRDSPFGTVIGFDDPDDFHLIEE